MLCILISFEPVKLIKPIQPHNQPRPKAGAEEEGSKVAG